jgi:hypothetical protein
MDVHCCFLVQKYDGGPVKVRSANCIMDVRETTGHMLLFLKYPLVNTLNVRGSLWTVLGKNH